MNQAAQSQVTATQPNECSTNDSPVLWIVTELYYPEETSTGYYLTKIAESLAGDFTVRVVCGQPNYAARGIRAARSENYKNVEINRVFGATLDKNKIPSRVYNMATLSLSVFYFLLRKMKRGEQVLVVTTPPTLPLITTLAALLRGAGSTLLIHDNYPEILVASGKVSETSPVVKINEHLNRWVYKYAAKIIVVGRDMRELLLRKTEGFEVPVEVIPNWAELETVHPQEKSENRLLNELGLEKKTVFLYAGNMGYPNDLESIVNCAEKLSASENQMDRRIHFIFLGAGVKKKWLAKIIDIKKLQNVTLLEPRPRSEQTDFLNACDVALVSLVGKMRGVSMPSRTYNILAAGKPILGITDINSELALVIDEERVGWISAPGDWENLLQIIRRINEDLTGLAEMGRRARAAAEKKYTAEIILEKYLRALNGRVR